MHSGVDAHSLHPCGQVTDNSRQTKVTYWCGMESTNAAIRMRIFTPGSLLDHIAMKDDIIPLSKPIHAADGSFLSQNIYESGVRNPVPSPPIVLR